ncbi:hypothetical protein [Frigoribacterium sp. MCBA15_019]|uniref:hypothetical protein n=1 Tax=unclassified Frigoribacterium TaxID=2627005 RepID=UPI0008DCE5E8|nr:hypothetical protein [Frigoribacterium sp. MCBA15_019]OII27739.1 hypothetical protein BIV04_04350 [Frigoribacterium sp. MCBA15_019]
MNKATVVTLSMVAGVVVVAGVVTAVVISNGAPGPEDAQTASSSSTRPSASPTPSAPVTPSPSVTSGSTPRPTATPVGPGQTTTKVPEPIPDAATVTPLVTFDQWSADTRTLTIGATVPGTLEDDGTCTVTATNGGLAVAGTFTAQATASSTDCGSMPLQSDTFTTGTWSVSVAYASSTSVGSVTDYEVTIP